MKPMADPTSTELGARSRTLLKASLLGLAMGCGAPPVEPQAPAAPAPATTSAPGAAPAADSPPAAEAPAPAAGPEPAAPPGDAPAETSSPPSDGPTLGSQNPIDVITARDAAYLVDYASSTHKPTSEARCDKEAKEDAEKRAACVTKAREQFLPDVLRFKKDASGKVSLQVYKRNGSLLTEVSTGAVELTQEGADGVKIKFKQQKGTRPLWRGRQEGIIRVPNSYTVELDDPDLGHLRYDAKVGLVSQ
jgi:hypothetical protein